MCRLGAECSLALTSTNLNQSREALSNLENNELPSLWLRFHVADACGQPCL
jgi:hypothetical protein